jgi:hypothetical protein
MERRLILVLAFAGSILSLGVQPAQPAARSGPNDFDGWTLSQKEHFLLTARIESENSAGKGVTHSRKAMLSDSRVNHAAHIQTIDVHLPLFKGKDGSEERDFSDSWKYNVAAYRLAKLLHLADRVPVCVEREIDGQRTAVDWWVDGVLMDEKERVGRNITPPDVAAWNRQMATIRLFDQLIYNMDRSQENLLITTNWKVWMIDHTRAFRKWRTLRDASVITQCSPDLLRSLKSLNRRDLDRELSSLLTPEQIDSLLVRRDLIVEKLQAKSTAAYRRP